MKAADGTQPLVASFMKENASGHTEPIVFKRGPDILTFTDPHVASTAHVLPSNLAAFVLNFIQNEPLHPCRSCLHHCMNTSYELTGVASAYVERLNLSMRGIQANGAAWMAANPPARYQPDATFVSAFAPLQMILQLDTDCSPKGFIIDLGFALANSPAPEI
jgi:hypothetical protein